MLEKFKTSFLLDSASTPTKLDGGAGLPPDVANLLSEFGGSSFNGGLYRVIRGSDVDVWASRIGYAFPEFKDRVTCFGYDWLGRAFAVDVKRLEAGKPGVVMFEPGSGQVLKIPANMETFHENELINFGDAALAMNFYREWQERARVNLAYNQCVGYRRPLFLGGLDNVDNLDVSDIDVYWNILGQLILKSKGLPIGTPVRTRIG